MMLRKPIILGLALAVYLSPMVPAMAQSDTENGAVSQKNDGLIDEIVSAAEKRGVHIILIDAADGSALSTSKLSTKESDQAAKSIIDSSALINAQSGAADFRRILKDKLTHLPDSIGSAIENLKNKSPDGRLWSYFRVLYWSLLLLLIGVLVEREIYFKRIAGRRLASRQLDNPVGYTEKLPLLVKRASLRIAGVAISMGIAYLIGITLFKETVTESIQFTIAIIYISYAACRIVPIIWRMILAPFLHHYRIPQFSNHDARRLYHWLWVTATVNIVALMFSVWVGELASNNDVDAFLASIFGFVIALLNTLMVLINRQAISRAIRNGKASSEVSYPIRLLSDLWVPVAVTYFIFSWLQMTYRLVQQIELSTPLIAGAYAILISVIVVCGLANYVIERAFHRERQADTEKYDALESDAGIEPVQLNSNETDNGQENVGTHHTLNNYEDLARRIAGFLALIAGFWALTAIWNVDNTVMYDAVVRQSLDVMAILFIGYIVYHIVRIWIDRKIEEEGGVMVALAPGDEGGASGASRLATLLPLFRNFMLIVVAVSVIFSALLEVGINVSPLFAGAGVVGLAIGFGAQTLVRDIFSGAFYLFDDAFRKGEYVDIGSVKGTVEKISIRSFQLRHHLGPLHTIPFGEIQFLTNYSRDWVLMKLPLRLTYDTDLEKVRKLIKKLGIQLMEDPVIGGNFLQPLKSQGVIEMQDSAMIIRVKFMTKPGDQWVIRKRVFQDIRDLFEREGIKFAHREVTVRLAGEGSNDLTQVQKQAVAAAALGDELDEENSQDSSDDR